MKNYQETWIIDRHEGDYTVLERANSTHLIDIPRVLLPFNCREGDVLCVQVSTHATESEWHIIIDAEATAERQKAMQERLEQLASEDPGDDITL